MQAKIDKYVCKNDCKVRSPQKMLILKMLNIMDASINGIILIALHIHKQETRYQLMLFLLSTCTAVG